MREKPKKIYTWEETSRVEPSRHWSRLTRESDILKVTQQFLVPFMFLTHLQKQTSQWSNTKLDSSVINNADIKLEIFEKNFVLLQAFLIKL